MAPLQAIFSIHDVMPQTLDGVAAVIIAMDDAGLPPADLLVCPGTGWDEAGLRRLKNWERAGHRLVGHGWSHQVRGIHGVKHRLHSALISRRAGEHLALSGRECVELMESCFLWFSANGFHSPDLYVPPAWAMGRVARRHLRQLPFRFYEVLSGVYDSHRDRFLLLPVLGFEADTAARALTLRFLNRASVMAARVLGKPARVSIHPFDLECRLAARLIDVLKRKVVTVALADVFP